MDQGGGSGTDGTGGTSGGGGREPGGFGGGREAGSTLGVDQLFNWNSLKGSIWDRALEYVTHLPGIEHDEPVANGIKNLAVSTGGRYGDMNVALQGINIEQFAHATDHVVTLSQQGPDGIATLKHEGYSDELIRLLLKMSAGNGVQAQDMYPSPSEVKLIQQAFGSGSIPVLAP
jgi:hypothetical protein